MIQKFIYLYPFLDRPDLKRSLVIVSDYVVGRIFNEQSWIYILTEALNERVSNFRI